MSDQENTRSAGLDDAGYGGTDAPEGSSHRRCRGDGQGFSMDAWWEGHSLPKKILWGIVFAIGGIGLTALFGFVVMALWNWLMPEVFGLTQVSYWQAWGLLVLCWILFKGWHFHDSDSNNDRKRRRELRRYMREDQPPAGEAPSDSPQASTDC